MVKIVTTYGPTDKEVREVEGRLVEHTLRKVIREVERRFGTDGVYTDEERDVCVIPRVGAGNVIVEVVW